MNNVNDANLRQLSLHNFVSDSVNKIVSTLVPEEHTRASNQLINSIGAKSYGTITFTDNKSNRAEFIRIPPEAPVSEVKKYINTKWCHERPSLVISVTGGAKDYDMKPKLLRAFRRGLLKVASTTGAWIITGGMNTGIMKLVGEIVEMNPSRCRRIHLFGIATWGCVAGRDKLNDRGKTVEYTKPTIEEKNTAPLEPNHTKFIFIDDGSEGQFGREITFRARLERAISGDFFGARSRTTSTADMSTSTTTTPSFRPEQSDPVPVVLLVVEGGPNTVRTVHEAVVENNIPAVFFEGTGRCCDLFAKAVHLYAEYEKNLEGDEEISSSNVAALLSRRDGLKNQLREALKAELYAIGGVSNPPTISSDKKASKNSTTTMETKNQDIDSPDYFALVYECITTRRKFLNIVSLNSQSPVEPDIDLAILRALLRATSGSDAHKTNYERKREQFQLALEWNRVDIVKNEIMQHDRDWASTNLNDLFELALNRSQTAFVKLFLDHDFSLTDLFRNNDKLSLLYKSSMSKEHFEKISKSNNPLRTIYKIVLQPLIGDFFKVDVALRSQVSRAHTGVNLDINHEEYVCCTTSSRSQNDTARTLNQLTGSLPLESAALIATLIYRKRAEKENDINFEQRANDFEALAVHILNRFYRADPRTCIKAVIRQIPAYGNVTWLELAAKAEAKQFFAQRAVQDVLNNIWYGYIDQRESEKKIIFSTFMLWYSGFLYYHDELVKFNDETRFLDDLLSKSSLSPRTHTTKALRVQENTRDSTQTKLIHGVTDMDNNTPVEFVAVGRYENIIRPMYLYFDNILKFMRSPYVKYLYNLYFHLIFLLLFSYVVLCGVFPLYEFETDVCRPTIDSEKQEKDDDKSPSMINTESKTNTTIPYGLQKRNHPAITEYILLVWVTTLLCEEMRQLFSSEAQTTRNAIVQYFEVFWNQLDVLAIILFYVGFILRCLPLTECFCAARIVWSIDIAIWYIRSLDIFAAIKRLGPKLVMIGEMMNDLKFYMVLLIVFILGFGVSSHSLIYGTKEFSWHLPRELLHLSYWQIFGELDILSKFENNYRATGNAVFILLVTYMAIASILLVNLLIAMFSNTFDRLQNDTDRIWKFQRYSLICEYLSRPSIPPPFIFVAHLWRLILTTLSLCSKSSWIREKHDQHLKQTTYAIMLEERFASNIETIEDAFGDEVYHSCIKSAGKFTEEHDLDEERVQTPQDSINKKIQILETRQDNVLEYLRCLMDGMKIMGGARIKLPELRRLDAEESTDETIGPSDQSRQGLRRDSIIADTHRTSITPDTSQVSSMNFFRSLKTVSLSIGDNAVYDVHVCRETIFNKLVLEDNSYNHLDEGKDDMPAHVKCSLLGSSINILIALRRLVFRT
ncbi:unnamed protein product [Rotaria sp. Silwood1]|nr:unnamed protein product [Rotaria sp. Silwood1]CAF3615773.1 unnamed protein product [Rotaria sp. Silwood1]